MTRNATAAEVNRLTADAARQATKLAALNAGNEDGELYDALEIITEQWLHDERNDHLAAAELSDIAWEMVHTTQARRDAVIGQRAYILGMDAAAILAAATRNVETGI